MSSDQALVAQMMEHVTEQMDRLQEMHAASDASRSEVDKRLGQLADSIGRMTDKLETEAALAGVLTQIAEGQDRVVTALETMAEQGGGIDPESRMRLRSIDVQLLRLLEEISAGRAESTAALRADLAALTRAVAGRGPAPGRMRLVDPVTPDDPAPGGGAGG